MDNVAMTANAFASTFYFFSTHKITAEKNKKSLQANAPDNGGFVQTLTDIALNVNRFGQSVCGLEKVVLRGNSRAAANNALEPWLGLCVACFRWFVDFGVRAPKKIPIFECRQGSKP